MSVGAGSGTPGGSADAPDLGRRLLGLLLAGPATLVWVLTLALPTLQTVLTSRRNTSPLGDRGSVGWENYSRVVDDPAFGRALGFTLALTLERVLIVALVPLVLALVVNEFGRRLRIPVRMLFTLPLALYAPVAGALTWLLILNPQSGLLRGGGSPLADAARAPGTVLRIDALTIFGVGGGLGLIVFLAALRGTGGEAPAARRVGRALLAAWLVTLCGTAAYALQSFTLGRVLTGGGPGLSTTTLSLLQFTFTFQNFQFGRGAAIATLILAATMALGIVAGLIVIAGGLRLETVPQDKPVGIFSPAKDPLVILVLALTMLGVLVVSLVRVVPALWVAATSLKGRAEALRAPGSFLPADPTLDAYGQVAELIPLARVVVNTIVPVALPVLLAQLPLAFLAALGIGALRPLGRHSEWLLLPFSPWLFVTVSPLSPVLFETIRDARLINTLPGLIPPLGLSVPILFVLTLFFKGQSRAWRAAPAPGAFFRRVIVPSLPLALLLGAAALLVGMQDLLWPLIVANRSDHFTIPVALTRLNATAGASAAPPTVAAALTLFGLPPFLIFFVTFGLLQALYLDRLAVGTRADGE